MCTMCSVGKKSFYLLLVVLQIIVVVKGSPINSTKGQNLTSSPCPEEQVYYNGTGKCHSSFEVGTRGPCELSMMFTLDTTKDEKEAHCDCDKFSSGKGCPYRPFVFWPEKNRCYPIYDKGPCNGGNEWLVLDDEGKAYCRVNEHNCSYVPFNGLEDGADESHYLNHLPLSSSFTFEHNGTCEETGTKGFCKDGERLDFLDDGSSKLGPQCYNKIEKMQNSYCFPEITYSLAVTGEIPCATGTKRVAGSGCSPIADF